MFKITLLKIIDLIIGSLLSFILPLFVRYKPIEISSVKKILFIRPGGIGDFILLIPVIQKFQKHFPEAAIDVLCEKRNHEVSSFLNNVHTIYIYDKGFDLIKCIKNNYDVIIDTEQWHRLSAVTSFLSNAPVRIGFNTNSRKRLLTHKIPYSHEEYEIQSFLHLLNPLKMPSEFSAVSSPFIHLKNDLSKIKFENENQTIAIAPGASVPERIWNISKYAEIAGRLIRNGYIVILLGGNNDKKLTKQINEYEPACIDLAGKTNLTETSIYLKKSRVLLSPDSGIMHLAYALNVPTISLFGAGIEKKWAPKGENHKAINKHLSCSPCTRFGYTKHCRNRTECLKEISTSDVFEAFEAILHQTLSD